MNLLEEFQKEKSPGHATSLIGWSGPLYFGAGLAFDKKGGRLGRGGGWVLRTEQNSSYEVCAGFCTIPEGGRFGGPCYIAHRKEILLCFLRSVCCTFSGSGWRKTLSLCTWLQAHKDLIRTEVWSEPLCSNLFCGRYYDLFLQNYLLLAKDKGWKQPWLGEIYVLSAALENFYKCTACCPI